MLSNSLIYSAFGGQDKCQEDKRRRNHLDGPFNLSKRQRQASEARPRAVILGIAKLVHLFCRTRKHPLDIPAVHEWWSRGFLAKSGNQRVRMGAENISIFRKGAQSVAAVS